MTTRPIDRVIDRVIDLIAELQQVSPTVPVEVWVTGGDPGPATRYQIDRVLQMTPSLLKDLGESDLRDTSHDSIGPLPTVIIIKP
jgi:hypothetical protein